MTGDNVVRLVSDNRDRQPPLTDAELVQLRQMLVTHTRIIETCPIAMRAAAATKLSIAQRDFA